MYNVQQLFQALKFLAKLLFKPRPFLVQIRSRPLSYLGPLVLGVLFPLKLPFPNIYLCGGGFKLSLLGLLAQIFQLFHYCFCSDQRPEQSIASARASVMIYDDLNKKWIPSGASHGLSKVHIYHHFINNTFRVVGRKLQDHEVILTKYDVTQI